MDGSADRGGVVPAAADFARCLSLMSKHGRITAADLEKVGDDLVAVVSGIDAELGEAVGTIFGQIAEALGRLGIIGGALELRGENDWILRIEFDETLACFSPGGSVTMGLCGIVLRYVGGLFATEVDGVVEIDGLRLHCDLSLPDFVLSAATAAEDTPGESLFDFDPGDPPPWAEGAEQDEEAGVVPALPDDAGGFLTARGLGLGAGGGTGPRITRAGVVLAPAFNRYILYVSVADALTLGEAVKFDQVEIEALYEGGVEARATGRAAAVMRLGAGETPWGMVALAAELREDGWRFDGHAEFPDATTLGDAMATVAQGGKPVPLPAWLAGTALTGLSASYEMASGALALDAAFAWHDSATARLAFASAGGAITVDGSLALDGGDIEIALGLRRDGSAGSLLFGSFDAERAHLDLAKLVRLLAPAESGAAVVADAAQFSIDRALVAVAQSAEGKRQFLVAAEIDAGFDLSALRDLPFLGGLIPAGDSIGFGLRPILAWPDADSWFEGEGAPASLLRGIPGPVLPEILTGGALHCSVDVKLGGAERRQVDVELGGLPAPPQPGGGGNGRSEDHSGAKWIDVQKSLGPLHISRLGIGMSGNVLDIRADAAVSFAGVTLSAQGLGLSATLPADGVALTLRPPVIDGFGLDLRRDPLTLAGAFLRKGDEFEGAVTIGGPEFSLRAYGGLMMLGHAPSMFLYGALDTPIGGPPFFFVEAIAAGFGLHRHLRLPELDKIHDFPLLAALEDGDAAFAKGGRTPTTADRLEAFHDYVEPRLDAYFFAAGLRFNSFKMVKGVAVAVLRAEQHVDLSFVGAATYLAPPVPPPGLPPIARIELDIFGQFSPDEGIVRVEGALDHNSFLYSGLCTLRGGFAYVSWFGADHAGDFVLSVGGYRDQHRKPRDHYPDVERARIEWNLGHGVEITGAAYCALTPALIMAGVSVDAKAHVGSVEAWFHFSVDFTLEWEPFHYEAQAHVEVGARWGPFSTTASATLEIWGPDFNGIAEVHWTVISFTVGFGKDGSKLRHPGTKPPALGWDAFVSSFLSDGPETAAAGLRGLVTARVAGGLVATGTVNKGGGRDGPAPGDAECWIVNPHDLRLVISSAVPIATVTVDGKEVERRKAEQGGVVAVGPLGIRPMGVNSVAPELQIRIEAVGDEKRRPKKHFVHDHVARNFPAALWGPGEIPPTGETPPDLVSATAEVTLMADEPDHGDEARRSLASVTSRPDKYAVATSTRRSWRGSWHRDPAKRNAADLQPGEIERARCTVLFEALGIELPGDVAPATPAYADLMRRTPVMVIEEAAV